MKYRIEWKTSALREFRKLPADLRDRIERLVACLEEEPRPPGCRKLTGTGRAFRVRAGNYRVVYEVMDDVVLVTILRVRHRSESYRGD